MITVTSGTKRKLLSHNEATTFPANILQTPHITSVQYCGGCSVHWRLFSTSGGYISTVGDSFSTVGDSFSTVEVVQYSGGIASVLWGDSSVLWRWFSTVGG